jgi:hypothetical protein
MIRTEGLRRFVRFLRQLLLGIAIFAVAVLAFGYLFFTRRVNTQETWRDAVRELHASVLHYGEVPMWEAHVYQRHPTNYFRGANGVLAVTRDRLLYVGIEPKNQLTSEDAPSAILTSEFVNDTLLKLTLGRMYLFTARGVHLSRDGQMEEYAAMRGHEAELDSLVAYVGRSHTRQRSEAAAERILHEQITRLIRRPLIYKIQRGDALLTIATRFGTTPELLRKWNHLSGDKIRVHDTLLVKPEGDVP